MKRKGPQRYPTEVIQQAIAKYENGARLSAIAREFGVQKSTAKYWLDNAAKFLQDGPGNKSPVLSRIQNRLTKESWDIIFAAFKSLRGKLEEAPVRDLIAVISELFDRQAQFGALSNRGAVPDPVLEKSEEVRITVQRYLEKRKSASPEKESNTSLGGPALEQTQELTTIPPAGEAAATETEANGAT